MGLVAVKSDRQYRLRERVVRRGKQNHRPLSTSLDHPLTQAVLTCAKSYFRGAAASFTIVST